MKETGIDPGKSKAAYIAEKGLGGAATSVEGAYNNILDNARAQVNAQLTNGYVTDTGVNLRDMQNFWAAVFGGKHAQYAQDTQAADKAVAEQLPAAADRLRSTKAAEYAQGLDEKYGAKRLRRQADKITANELLTEQDSRTVDKLLRGDIDPEDVKGENRGGILRVYAAKKAVQDSLAPVKEYNAQRRAGLASEAAQDIAKSDAWKDKPGGLFFISFPRWVAAN